MASLSILPSARYLLWMKKTLNKAMEDADTMNFSFFHISILKSEMADKICANEPT